MVKNFTIDFHGRTIKINFESPKFIGDGKGFLQLLNMPAGYCYLCEALVQDGQCIDKIKDNFKIERSIKGMWKKVNKLKKKWKKSKSKKKFTDFFFSKKEEIYV